MADFFYAISNLPAFVCGAGALRSRSTKPQKFETCTVSKIDPARQRPQHDELAQAPNCLLILPVQDSNTTFHSKFIFFWAGQCSIQRFANCMLFRVPAGTRLALERAQRFDAILIFDSRHVGSQPTTLCIARTICFKDESLAALVQNFACGALGY